MTIPLEREALLPRIDGIRKNIARLRELSLLPTDEFSRGDAFDLAQHHLRLALEGVFHIGSHILSRLPGGRPVEYAGIALKLGELNVVEPAFAQSKLVPMAKLRNLLVHQYADIDAARLQGILRDHLVDIEAYLGAVGDLLERPDRLGLEIV